MCGIAGLIHKGKSSNVGGEMTAMLQALKHRGPDSTGYAVYGEPTEGDYVMRLKVAEAEDMYECMTRARAADAYYNESVAAAADRLPAVPPPEMRPKRVPGKVTTFKPADSGEVVFGNEAKPDGQGETTEASEAETVKETNTETASEKAPEASAQPDPPANPPAASASQKSGMAAGESQKNATKKKKPKRSRTNATICI